MIGSAICAPILWTGLSACIAPWNTIEASVQRIARSEPGLIVSTSLPLSRTSPVTSVPGGSSRSIAAAIVDLPHPDSPARPSTSPLATSRSIPRTAGTGPACVLYETYMSFTDRRFAPSAVIVLVVEPLMSPR